MVTKSGFQYVAVLFDVKGLLANRPGKSVVDFLPMKDLAGVKRLLQIEIRGCDFCQFHFSKVARRKNSVT
jgi:hypothetical protein